MDEGPTDDNDDDDETEAGDGFGDEVFLDGEPLADCEEGDPVNEAVRCPWVSEGFCYETRMGACACACPRNKSAVTCQSGFESGEQGRVNVHCY